MYPFFEYWQFIQGIPFEFKTLWANNGRVVTCVIELQFLLDSSSSQNLFEVHKTGIQAGLTILFTVRMGQKEAEKFLNKNRLCGRTENVGIDNPKDADKVVQQKQAWAGNKELHQALHQA